MPTLVLLAEKTLETRSLKRLEPSDKVPVFEATETISSPWEVELRETDPHSESTVASWTEKPGGLRLVKTSHLKIYPQNYPLWGIAFAGVCDYTECMEDLLMRA